MSLVQIIHTFDNFFDFLSMIRKARVTVNPRPDAKKGTYTMTFL